MKKLVYIGNRLSQKGRTVTSIETLGNALAKEGYSVTMASDRHNKVLRLLDMLWVVFKHRKTTDYVLIDTYSTLNFYYAFLVGTLCRILKLNYLPILHGGNLPNRLEVSPGLSKALFKNAYCNICPSPYIYEAFKTMGYKNLTVIPNTISIEQYPCVVKCIDAPKMLWVRSLADIYNPEMAIRVLHQLKQKGYEAELCMVGPDKDNMMRALVDLAESLNVCVDFKGKLSKAAWIQLSKQYNIFINTTHFDNMPVSVIEAMALGFLVVSTRVGGIPYLIQDGANGLLVDDGNTKQMVNKITTLIETPMLVSQLSKQARATAMTFNWQQVKDKWHQILK